jgi:predicted nuclease with TOPRIM domain
MIDWMVYLPVIAKIVGPRILDVVAERFKSTPEEAEKAKLRKMLQKLRDEVSDLFYNAKKKSKSEIVEKIREMQEKIDSDDYQEALRPDAAGIVLDSLQVAAEERKAGIPNVLKELRTLLNTWLHDLKFTNSLPEA